MHVFNKYVYVTNVVSVLLITCFIGCDNRTTNASRFLESDSTLVNKIHNYKRNYLFSEIDSQYVCVQLDLHDKKSISLLRFKNEKTLNIERYFGEILGENVYIDWTDYSLLYPREENAMGAPHLAFLDVKSKLQNDDVHIVKYTSYADFLAEITENYDVIDSLRFFNAYSKWLTCKIFDLSNNYHLLDKHDVKHVFPFDLEVVIKKDEIDPDIINPYYKEKGQIVILLNGLVSSDGTLSNVSITSPKETRFQPFLLEIIKVLKRKTLPTFKVFGLSINANIRIAVSVE